MFYIELSNEETRDLLKKDFNKNYSLEAIDWIEKEISWSNYGENELAIFDGNYIKDRYDECSLYDFFKLIKVNINELDFLDKYDIIKIFGDYIPKNFDIKDYLKNQNNFYSVLRKLPKNILTQLIEDYCDDMIISYLILENGNIVFDLEN